MNGQRPKYGTASGVGLVQWEEHELNQVQTDQALVETENEAIVLARRGQGLFKKRVMTLLHTKSRWLGWG